MGCRICGVGFMVQDLRLRVKASEVYSAGFTVEVEGCRGVKCKADGVG